VRTIYFGANQRSAAPLGLEIVLMLNPQLKLWAIIGRHSVAERAWRFATNPLCLCFLVVQIELSRCHAASIPLRFTRIVELSWHFLTTII
jgi:hypothetical protein